MSGEYILDANVVIDLLRGDKATISRLAQIKEIKISVIVIGELYFGANKSNQTPKRLQEIQQLEKLVTILDILNGLLNNEFTDSYQCISGFPISLGCEFHRNGMSLPVMQMSGT